VTGYRSGVILLLILSGVPGLAFSSEDPCRIAYLHADKLSEERACEAAASAGDANAELGLGLILWSGVDRPTALEWFRKSARQGNIVAQRALGTFLARDDIAADLRNPAEAYAWRMTCGNEEGARKLRGTFSESEASSADTLASDYLARYGNKQILMVAGWLRIWNTFLVVWPFLIVLYASYVLRKQLSRKFPFLFAGVITAYLIRYLTLWAFEFAIIKAAVRVRDADGMHNLTPWVFWTSNLLAVVVPVIGVLVLYRFWMSRRWVQATQSVKA
jgi:hypothetical protein